VSKNVAVFVDVANIFYAAKAAGVDIDYVTLLKAGSAGRDLVRAYAYTGLDPDNENQRNFHEFLRRHGYKVVSKDIRKYGDGKVKANLDIELVVDMMKTARNLDIAIVVSGDGDFAPAIRAVQEMGVRVEVVSFRGNTSSDLIEVADQFTDITQIAKVEKGSSRSGRRVADDDEDLSMTEVPDKLFEGTGESRRGRGRSRTRTTEPTPVAASRSRTSRAAAVATVAAAGGEIPIVVLPGEKLSKVAAVAPSAPPSDAEVDEAAADAADDEAADAMAAANGEVLDMSEEGQRRRRRRRGGRGRGRGRGRDEATPEGAPERAALEPEDAEDVEPIEAGAPPARRPAASAFGSVWDSQIGIPAAGSSSGRQPAPLDEEDFDEPPIPEYLIAERRQRDAARPGRGPSRGRGGAYAAAMDRERFGGGRGSTMSRFNEPPPRRDSGPNRVDRPVFRPSPVPGPRPAPRATGGDEPWSEVPPEIEAMLRAQMGGASGRPARRDDRGTPPASREAIAGSGTAPASGVTTEAAEAPAAAPRRRTVRRPSEAVASGATIEAGSPEAAATAAPKRRSTRTARGTGSATASDDTSIVTSDATNGGGTAAQKRPTTRATRAPRAAKPATTSSDASETAGDSADATATAAPNRRAARKRADAPA
jgi:uncharacterized LabA/DUF88 family protein